MNPSEIVNKLNKRYAVKKMNGSETISEKLEAILESARLSASSYGLQPYRLIVVSDPDVKEKLQIASFNQEKVTQSSHMLVLAIVKDINESFIDKFIRLNAETRNKPLDRFEGLRSNIIKKTDKFKAKNQIDDWAKRQAYIALGSILSTAAMLDVDTCPMEGFVAEDYDKILGLDKLGLSAAVVCAVGERAEDDNYQHEKKVRWDKSDFFIHI